LVLGAEISGLMALVRTRTTEATVVETGEGSAGRHARPGDGHRRVRPRGGGRGALQGGTPALSGFRMDIHGDRGVLSLSGIGPHNCDLHMGSVVDGVVTEQVPVGPIYRVEAAPLPPNPVGTSPGSTPASPTRFAQRGQVDRASTTRSRYTSCSTPSRWPPKPARCRRYRASRDEARGDRVMTGAEEEHSDRIGVAGAADAVVGALDGIRVVDFSQVAARTLSGVATRRSGCRCDQGRADRW